MATSEDPNYSEEEGVCKYVSGNVNIRIQLRNEGSVNILNGVICPYYERKTFECSEPSCLTENGSCGYVNYYSRVLGQLFC